MSYIVYNLEFPSWCERFSVGPYEFVRLPQYPEAVRALQHNVTATAEFRLERGAGTHQPTATVAVPGESEPAVLRSTTQGATSFDDVLLLLSLITSRDVFVCREEDACDRHVGMWADPRVHFGGHLLRIGIPYQQTPGGTGCHDTYDGGFEAHLRGIYELTRTEGWRTKFKDGRYLELGLDAFRCRSLEARFVLSWTIWEHMYRLQHPELSQRQIRKTTSRSMVESLFGFILMGYSSDEAARRAIGRLVKTRNKLMHYGVLPEGDRAGGDAVLFLELTEIVIAKTLELEVGNALNTWDRLQSFLADQRVRTPSEILHGRQI